ncbi:hypothetical protein TVAG_458710 [Trichomonas vaginalis G3]|uniref:Uncharacterized protein n=1 Tax=Trichomonas vaginalis (strain ATCC PRA-98 / G3) TaxID=412133 RepID=A2E676_TRIV3|nr:hypothetical protein TVAGG3_0394140 [Trichomonas vaginalis G3]EAY11799.1 hypothetical protein TVAG_458710 [Trichomonas vaginalis G3]KAI5534205.1 hypothetical protein TVAGG3_0394140 [Trichomonas vaginalis G3]|eukprot:XP_001324022.1 hypothetical protein [Trichomonas vaginalis G3]
MIELPQCPPELNQKVFEMMESSGQNNRLCADYFTDFAFECLDSNIKYFKAPVHVNRDQANKIAARLIMEFLQEKDLVRTLNVVIKEGKSDLFSDVNDADLSALELNPRIPPIKKLMRQRYALPEESEGWFNIDSQVETTIHDDDDSEGGSTFSVATILEKVDRKNAHESLIGYARPKQTKRPRYTCNFSVASKSLSYKSDNVQNPSNDSRHLNLDAESKGISIKSDTKSRKSHHSKNLN